MHFFFVRVLPYIAFLGTGIASYVDNQQVILTQILIMISVGLSFLNPSYLVLSIGQMGPLVWIWLASLPGTVLLITSEGSVTVPLQQYVGLTAIWIVVWNIFRFVKYSPNEIFEIYIRCAVIAAFVAVLQQTAFLFGFQRGYDLRWLIIGAAELDYTGPFLRVSSTFTEPSYLAAFLTPALYFSLLRLSGKSARLSLLNSFVVIVALLFTFSTIGYIGFGLCVLFVADFKPRNFLISCLTILCLILIFIENPALFSRIDGIQKMLTYGISGDENLSALINGLNFQISYAILNDHPIFGVGLGGYRVYSSDYLENVITGNQKLIDQVAGMLKSDLTLTDSGSMYFRIFTEFGLFGVLILLVALFRILQRTECPEKTKLANAALLYILVFSIRSGQMVRFELAFFVSLFLLLKSRIKFVDAV